MAQHPGRNKTPYEGYFDVTVPLSIILGFSEDYRKIVSNAKHEIVLTRSRSDINAIVQARHEPGAEEQFEISIHKVEWMIPYVVALDQQKIHLLNIIGKDFSTTMSFRSCELYEYPLLPTTSRRKWAVKTSTQLEKPRYIVLGFQTGRKDKLIRHAKRFDHCNITNVKLFLNSQYYP
ncbi:uncharacterized protein LOC117182987 [Belonocnema kinseyi]|uniref:uncharacterized protein LOC117182987 n=1 Tax=Belonocnema kinseyi TaxID=2817044 RepID=UPI00143D028F|nr:uncharacterized protein LOC117182987 [Belonocnema kinseyi]